jgi:hypothetical protein
MVGVAANASVNNEDTVYSEVLCKWPYSASLVLLTS